jgi:putative two-component system response regulator
MHQPPTNPAEPADLNALLAEADDRLKKKHTDNQQWFSELANFLLRDTTSRFESKDVVELLSHCMRHFYVSRDRQLAIVIGEHALALAVKAKLPKEERFLCNFIGIFHKDSGKFVLAIEYLVRAVGIARRIGDCEAEAASWTNLASVANLMGLYDDAIKYGRRALALITGRDSDAARAVQCGASQIMARALQALGQFENAMVSIRHAVAHVPPPKNSVEYLMRVRISHAHAVIALRLDQVEEARNAADKAAVDALRCGGSEAAVHASVATAMVDAREGQFEVADATTQRLLEEYSKDSTLVLDLYLARLYVLEQAKRMEEAEALRHRFRGEWQKHKMNNVIAQLRVLDKSAQDQATPADTSTQTIRERLEELAIIGELHDDQTGDHAFRVGRLAGLLALRLGLGHEEADAIDIAARLHDIGKITTPPEILMKPSKLTPDEWAVMKDHAIKGHEILSTRKDPLMAKASLIALNHHERWDGQGYPNGVKGDDIPLVAQIAALADVFDALTHSRCYKPAWTVQAALTEIDRTSRSYGKREFNPNLSNEFIKLVRELLAEHGEDGLDAYLSARAADSAFRNARAAAGTTLESNQLGMQSLVVNAK